MHRIAFAVLGVGISVVFGSVSDGDDTLGSRRKSWIPGSWRRSWTHQTLRSLDGDGYGDGPLGSRRMSWILVSWRRSWTHQTHRSLDGDVGDDDILRSQRRS